MSRPAGRRSNELLSFHLAPLSTRSVKRFRKAVALAQYSISSILFTLRAHSRATSRRRSGPVAMTGKLVGADYQKVPQEGDLEVAWIVVCLQADQNKEMNMQSRLMTYSAPQQHWGTYLRGFNWNVYGCGTYREPVSAVRAEVLMKRYMERLSRKLKAPVSYFAALERRYSGCGMPPIPAHWHFLAACDPAYGMREVAQALWTEKFGDAKVDVYDPSQGGAFYISKLAGHANGEFTFANLDLLAHHGPSDLMAAAHASAYVPDHLKDKLHGQYGVVR